MSNLQIKNVPPELHAALAERARSRGLTMSQYVLRLLDRDLTRPTIEDWLVGLAASWDEHAAEMPVDIDVVHTLDEVRLEIEERAVGASGSAEPEPPVRTGRRG